MYIFFILCHLCIIYMVYFGTDIRRHSDSNDEDDEYIVKMMIIFIASQSAPTTSCDEFGWL